MRYKSKITLPKLEKSFLATKIVLSATPIICYAYIAMKASMNGVNFQAILNSEPETTILLVNSMLNIYVAYLLHLAEKNLEKGKTSSAVMNMLLLLFTQLFSQNAFGFLMIAFVSHRSLSYYEISLKEIGKKITIKQFFFDAGGSFIVVLLNCITLFATIRLM